MEKLRQNLILGLVFTAVLAAAPVHAVVRCQAVHDISRELPVLEVLVPGLTNYQRGGVEYALQFTSFKELLRAYEKIRKGDIQGDNIYEKFLVALNVRLTYREQALQQIPAQGPLLVSSNHPYGGLDGIILLAMLGRIRSDVKFLAADMLAKVPELADGIIPVSFEKSPEGSAARQRAFEAAMAHVANGGALVIFPAGGVSQTTGWLGLGKALDTQWKPGAARILQATDATQVSVQFPGQNSFLFQFLGRIPGMRPLFLGREVVNKADHDISLRIAPPLKLDWKEDGMTPEELTQILRDRTDGLTE